MPFLMFQFGLLIYLERNLRATCARGHFSKWNLIRNVVCVGVCHVDRCRKLTFIFYYKLITPIALSTLKPINFET